MAILSIGSCDDAIREARDVMSKDGHDFNYLRVRAFPFSKDIEEFIDAHESSICYRTKSRWTTSQIIKNRDIL